MTRFAVFVEGDVEELFGRRRPTSSCKRYQQGDGRQITGHAHTGRDDTQAA